MLRCNVLMESIYVVTASQEKNQVHQCFSLYNSGGEKGGGGGGI